MNKIVALTKVLLKMNYADMLVDKKKRVLYAFSFLGLLLAGFLLIGPIAHSMYIGLEKFGHERLLLAMGLAVGSVWVFMISITTILTVFYYNQDVEMLLPLPLKPSQIITGKFITVLLAQYVTASFVILPILIVYGLDSGAGLVYYLYMVLIYLLFPIIPLVVASLLVTFIMRYTNIAKNKDRSNMFIGLFTLLFIVGINVFIQWRNKAGATEEAITQYFASDSSSLFVQMTNYFPTIYFGAMSLLESSSWKGLMYLLIFAAISFAFYALFFYVSERTYLKGVIGLSNSTAKKEVISKEEFTKTTVQHSHWKAYVKKEFRVIFRTPQFFLNCIVQTFIMPIMLFFLIFVQSGDLTWISDIVNDPKMISIALGLAFCGGMFLMGSNAIATTSFSREGSSWFVHRYLPMKAESIFFAKVFIGWAVNVTIFALFGVILMFVAKVPPLFVMLWFILCANGSWLLNLIGTRWDAQTADIHWDSEQKLFKSRYTTLWNFLANILLILLTVGGICALYFLLNVGMWTMFIIIFVVFAIANLILSRSLQLGAERILANIK